MKRISGIRVGFGVLSGFNLRWNLVLLISGIYLMFLGVFIIATCQILNMGLESYLLGLVVTVTGGILGIFGVFYSSLIIGRSTI